MKKQNAQWGKGICLNHVGPTEAYLVEDCDVFGVTIPQGYCTDGASVPRAFYSIIARFTDALPAAILHDMRYDPHEFNGVKQRLLTRKEADIEFYHNLRKSGINLVRASLAYSAVRAAGWKAWNNGTENGTKNVEDL